MTILSSRFGTEKMQVNLSLETHAFSMQPQSKYSMSMNQTHFENLQIVLMSFSCLAACYLLIAHYSKQIVLNGRMRKVFPNQTVYQGMFVNNLLHGKGKKIFSNGEIHKGYFLRGQLNGLGVRIYPSHVKEEGYFVDNWLHGKGRRILANGTVIEGIFKDGQLI